jgi:hypothetical protein
MRAGSRKFVSASLQSPKRRPLVEELAELFKDFSQVHDVFFDDPSSLRFAELFARAKLVVGWFQSVLFRVRHHVSRFGANYTGTNWLTSGLISMPDRDELKAEAEKCRRRARDADGLTMRILIELADQYEEASLLSADEPQINRALRARSQRPRFGKP